ncbi:MAG: Uma2 family endonuclease [Hymenobacter sp.]
MRLAEIPTDLFTLRGDVLTRMSEADFFRFCQANPTLQIERTAAQEIIIMPPAYPDSSENCGEVFFQVKAWSNQFLTGHTYESSAGFRFAQQSRAGPRRGLAEHRPPRRRAGRQHRDGLFSHLPRVRGRSGNRPPTRCATCRPKWRNTSPTGPCSASCSTPKPPRPTCTAPARPPKSSPASTAT